MRREEIKSGHWSDGRIKLFFRSSPRPLSPGPTSEWMRQGEGFCIAIIVSFREKSEKKSLNKFHKPQPSQHTRVKSVESKKREGRREMIFF